MLRFVNNLKTTLLLATMMAIFMAIGVSLGGRQGLIIAFIFGGAMNFFAYFFSDKIALATMGGKPADEREHSDLIHMVARLAKNAGLPMPRVFICPQEAPNAFATGRNPAHAAVAVTQGALRLLSYEELEGVIGHELAHVKNRDTLTSCIAATIAGAISMLAQMAYWAALFGGMGGRDDDRRGGNPIAAILMIILAPIAAALIQMAISRSREFVADHDGARIAGSAEGLISALRKLDAINHRVPMKGEMPTQSHMFIIQPLSGAGMASLFSTHPSTEVRIARLRELQQQIVGGQVAM